MLARLPGRTALAVGVSTCVMNLLLAAAAARAGSVHGTLTVGARVVQRCAVEADGEVRVGCGARATGAVVVRLPDGSLTAPLDATSARVVLERARDAGGTVTVHF